MQGATTRSLGSQIVINVCALAIAMTLAVAWPVTGYNNCASVNTFRKFDW
jgi:hypothetical protein